MTKTQLYLIVYRILRVAGYMPVEFTDEPDAPDVWGWELIG